MAFCSSFCIDLSVSFILLFNTVQFYSMFKVELSVLQRILGKKKQTKITQKRGVASSKKGREWKHCRRASFFDFI